MRMKFLELEEENPSKRQLLRRNKEETKYLL
jgi:hypothetical protein